MLAVSELRVGNYFLADDQPQTVSAINVIADAPAQSLEIGFYTGDQLHYLPAGSQRLQPMPLTDELLQKCGFKFDTYFKRWQKKKKIFGPGVDMELDGDYTALDFSGSPVLKEIKHLHHLQNLYYALKRQELMVDMTLNVKEEVHATIL